METTSCQIQKLDRHLWVKFRQMCLSQGISATAKVRSMIEAAVAELEQSKHEQGETDER